MLSAKYLNNYIRNIYNKIINPYTTFGFLPWNFISIYDFVENTIIEKGKIFKDIKLINYLRKNN